VIADIRDNSVLVAWVSDICACLCLLYRLQCAIPWKFMSLVKIGLSSKMSNLRNNVCDAC